MTRLFTMTCLALFLCLWTAGDLVVDLVFEAPDVTQETDDDQADNAAEHVLIPSLKAEMPFDAALMTAPDSDIGVPSIAVPLASRVSQRAAPSLDRPPRHAPVSFSIPLRL